MAELGETIDPRELIAGDPGVLHQTADTMTRFGEALAMVGSGLGRLDDGGWRGAAADAFRSRFDGEPGRWTSCGDAFHSASGALRDYASTVEWAHGEAGRAIDLWSQGNQATAQARQILERQNSATNGQPVPMFSDPGDAFRQQARAVLDHARAQVQSSGADAERIVTRAQAAAPQSPTWISTVAEGVEGVVEEVGEEVAGGVTRAAGDVVADFTADVGATVGKTMRDAGDTAGNLLDDVGEITGLDSVRAAGHTVARSVHGAADASEDAIVAGGAEFRNEAHQAAHDMDGRTAPVTVYIDEDEYPEAAKHIDEAQDGTTWRGDQQLDRKQPSEVTLDRDQANANRRDSLRGIPTRRDFDRDEYPPAIFDEGGSNASVKYISQHDNRGAGSTMGRQLTGVDNGNRVVIETY